MFLFYIILILFFIYILWFLPVQIRILYLKNKEQNKLEMQFKFLFLRINKDLSTPLIKILSLMSRKDYSSKSIKESLKSDRLPLRNWNLIFKRISVWFPKIMKIISHTIKFFSKILKPVRCKKLNVYTEIGLADAAQTGIAVGSVWAIYSFVLTELSKWIVLKPEIPKIKVIPNFNGSRIHLEYDCIIVFSLGHIIIVFIQMVRFFKVSTSLLKINTTSF